jgi:hypothetical protein
MANEEGTLVAGHRAGRIQPSEWTPPDGDWCFLIGSENADVEEDVEIGDVFGVEQEVYIGDVRTITFAMKLRNTTTAGIDFKASFLVGGTEIWSEQIALGATREYAKRTINVSHLTGVQTVALRLEAVP